MRGALTALAFAGLAAVADRAAAAEYCVTCTGPEAAYRCEVEGTPPGAGTDARAQLICISEMAAQGGHEACSVSRKTEIPCLGETRMVRAPDQRIIVKPPVEAAPAVAPQDAEPRPEDTGQAGTEPSAAAEAQPAPEQPQPAKKPPRTVEELAKRTVQSSKEGIEKAGDAVSGAGQTATEGIGKAGSAVGNAAKKTWNCLTSLFSDC